MVIHRVKEGADSICMPKWKVTPDPHVSIEQESAET